MEKIATKVNSLWYQRMVSVGLPLLCGLTMIVLMIDVRIPSGLLEIVSGIASDLARPFAYCWCFILIAASVYLMKKDLSTQQDTLPTKILYLLIGLASGMSYVALLWSLENWVNSSWVTVYSPPSSVPPAVFSVFAGLIFFIQILLRAELKKGENLDKPRTYFSYDLTAGIVVVWFVAVVAHTYLYPRDNTLRDALMVVDMSDQGWEDATLVLNQAIVADVGNTRDSVSAFRYQMVNNLDEVKFHRGDGATISFSAPVYSSTVVCKFNENKEITVEMTGGYYPDDLSTAIVSRSCVMRSKGFL